MTAGQRIGKALWAGEIWDILCWKIWKFSCRRGVFSSILKLQTLGGSLQQVNQINLKRLLTLRGRGTKPFVTREDGTQVAQAHYESPAQHYPT